MRTTSHIPTVGRLLRPQVSNISKRLQSSTNLSVPMARPMSSLSQIIQVSKEKKLVFVFW